MFTTLCFVVFCFFGRLALQDFPQLKLALASRRWRPVTGIVTRITDNSFAIDSASKYSSATQTQYSEDLVTVGYEVSSVPYMTRTYSFGGHADQPHCVHRVGDNLTVYYNPSNPAQAVVKRGVPLSLLLCPLLCLSGVGLVMWAIIQR